MQHRIGRKKYSIYAMDFETHNDSELLAQYEQNPESVETGVWLWYLINEESQYKDSDVYGYNLDSFFNRLSELSKPDKHTKKSGYICVYDYNLAFEWSFMLPVMKNMGFTFKAGNFEEDDEMVYNVITTSSMSSVWQIKMKMHKGNSEIIIRDLAKILGGGSLRKLAKSYNLPTQKGDIDYSKNRRVYYDDYDMPHVIDDRAIPPYYIPSDEELDYCFKDTKIIMDILNNENTINDKEFWKCVSASSYSFLKGINFGYSKAFKPKQAFRKDYPELDSKESEFLRKGVGGGITYAVPRYQYKEIIKGKKYNGLECDGVLHIDMHNAHPSQLHRFEFPYGKGHYYKFKTGAKLLKDNFIKNGYLFKGKITAVRCRVTYSSVKLHSVIQLIGYDSVYDTEITVWDFELLTMFKCYNNLKVELIDCYMYNSKKPAFSEYFKDNYDKRKIAKAEKDAYHIAYYKLLNNSFYGKLLEHGHNTTFIPNIDKSGFNETLKQVTLETDEDFNINGSFTYIPMGSAVPAHTRCWLIETALLFGYKNILYFDTDSIFMLDNKETRAVLETLPMEDDLYNWGMEENANRAQFACPKRYKLELENGETEAHVAGFDIKGETYDSLNIIEDERAIKRAYRIKGGTIISTQKKKISVDVKYRLIYDKNAENFDYSSLASII